MKNLKTISLVFLLVLLSVNHLTAQVKDLPPAKAKNNAVAKSDYESVKGGFKIAFPATPKISEQMVNVVGGETLMTLHQSFGATAFYIVGHLDAPFPITDVDELTLRYDNGRDGVVKKPSRKLIEERDFYFNERLGREIIVEDPAGTAIQRFLMVEQRFFTFVVAFPKKISQTSAAVKKSYRKIADKFFDSFAVTKLPAPETEILQLPESFETKIENGVISSQYLGFSMDLPANWKILNAEETELVANIAREEGTEKQKQIAHASLKNTKPLAMLGSGSPGKGGEFTAFLVIAAETLGYAKFDALAASQAFHKRDLALNGTKSTLEPKLIKIGGVDFAVSEDLDLTDGIRQRMYIANRKGFALEISVTYKSVEDLQIAEKHIQTLRFIN